MGKYTDVQKKIILLGDGEVGKTSLIRRFVVDKFDDKYILTIGSKITARALQIQKDNDLFYLKLQIWDILGQKGYDKLHKSSFRGTDGVMMVADLTRLETLDSLRTYWIPEVRNLVGTVPFVFIANKADLERRAEFKEDALLRLAKRHNAPYFLTSAKTGENVKNTFMSLGRKMLEMKRTEHPMAQGLLTVEGETGHMAALIDKIIDDFCSGYGKQEDAMPVLRKQFEIAEVSLQRPTKSALRKAVNRLATIEMDFKKTDIAEANRLKRLKWINEFRY